jgi:minor histocompatibility antigen H13
MFPVYGSFSLFGLYLLFKFFDKAWINYLLTCYFVLLGVGALTQVLVSISTYFYGKEIPGQYQFLFKVKSKGREIKFFFKKKLSENLDLTR